ncbi:hypothetical protein SM007_34630 [Streptomyces avermitilis]|uniref:Uncharacterized protein n=1 Tax=Streptomyces avermitilis TaxID=33903 RepID=A0A4D4N9C1_STRAX|nr:MULTISPECIES: hypothetical protein [Streptomyces]MYS96041.1 hypothetical protein [Streptomyces sp. SID5469]OOV21226.1 hypothetical protein SM007_34630 [Streptomyces avermitilis]BBJ47792.1 hypothetical protein SAVMC3_04210 [Streptomyces avermitilis]GDY69833.1 hypothetical protein SAV14893_092260 [Streptomyces avermitilis]GDY80099.1 hypothetical protein SAV31267_095840 [Streptomyces avermitilis]
MSDAHARPSRPGRAVLVLAALGLIPPAMVPAPRATAAPLAVSMADAAPETSPALQGGELTERVEQHPDRYGERPHLVRRAP